VGLRFASRAAVAAAAGALAVLAVTAGPVSATADASPAAAVAQPTLRLVDAADTPGKLDLRSAAHPVRRLARVHIPREPALRRL
jgi:hypothetical protein